MEASPSWNPQELSRPVMGLLYLLLKTRLFFSKMDLDSSLGGRIVGFLMSAL
jgi:hypothetical protein